LDCDASSFGIGACLGQLQDGQERIISFTSKTLSSAQKNFSVYERELLAIVTFVREFRHYLLGKHFVVRTDHQALKWLFSLSEPRGRLARWLETLAEFDFDILHRPGRDHGNADSLSRKAARLVDSSSDLEPASNHAAVDSCVTVAAPVVQVAATRKIPMEGLSVLSAEDLAAEQRKDPDLAVIIGWRGLDPHQERVDAPAEVSGVSRGVQELWVEREALRFVGDALYRQADGELQLCVPRSLREKALMSSGLDCTPMCAITFAPALSVSSLQRVPVALLPFSQFWRGTLLRWWP